MNDETQITDKPVEEMQAVSLEELKVAVWESAFFKGEAMDAAHKFDKALNAYREAVVKDERAKIATLEAWRQVYIAINSTWDAQAVGKLIGVPWGGDIRAAIQPAIESLQSERDTLASRAKELKEEVESLRGVLALMVDDALLVLEAKG